MKRDVMDQLEYDKIMDDYRKSLDAIERELEEKLRKDDRHYNQRTSVERVNAYLKDSYGCSKIYYQGAQKVASVLSCLFVSLNL